MNPGAVLNALFGAGTWGTGGNLVASAILGAAGLLVAWFGRQRIGRTLAAWWARHYGPHAVRQHQEALRLHEAARDQGDDSA